MAVIEIKLLTCGRCMTQQRCKIKNKVEPECWQCGPTTWIALPSIKPTPIQTGSPSAEDLHRMAHLFNIPCEWVTNDEVSPQEQTRANLEFIARYGVSGDVLRGQLANEIEDWLDGS